MSKAFSLALQCFGVQSENSFNVVTRRLDSGATTQRLSDHLIRNTVLPNIKSTHASKTTKPVTLNIFMILWGRKKNTSIHPSFHLSIHIFSFLPLSLLHPALRMREGGRNSTLSWYNYSITSSQPFSISFIHHSLSLPRSPSVISHSFAHSPPPPPTLCCVSACLDWAKTNGRGWILRGSGGQAVLSAEGQGQRRGVTWTQRMVTLLEWQSLWMGFREMSWSSYLEKSRSWRFP